MLGGGEPSDLYGSRSDGYRSVALQTKVTNGSLPNQVTTQVLGRFGAHLGLSRRLKRFWQSDKFNMKPFNSSIQDFNSRKSTVRVKKPQGRDTTVVPLGVAEREPLLIMREHAPRMTTSWPVENPSILPTPNHLKPPPPFPATRMQSSQSRWRNPETTRGMRPKPQNPTPYLSWRKRAERAAGRGFEGAVREPTGQAARAPVRGMKPRRSWLRRIRETESVAGGEGGGGGDVWRNVAMAARATNDGTLAAAGCKTILFPAEPLAALFQRTESTYS
uniref:Uncharacterized protein n=1 Tax=Oryza punctata TaxID=4537 RepID=A0A0E0MG96_ORYPU